MITHQVDIPEECTPQQFISILDTIGLIHSEPNWIENDLTKLRGKTVKINAANDRIVVSYVVTMPDRIEKEDEEDDE